MQKFPKIGKALLLSNSAIRKIMSVTVEMIQKSWHLRRFSWSPPKWNWMVFSSNIAHTSFPTAIGVSINIFKVYYFLIDRFPMKDFLKPRDKRKKNRVNWHVLRLMTTMDYKLVCYARESLWCNKSDICDRWVISQ